MGTEIVSMPTFWIIKHFDVIKDVSFRFIPVFIAFTSNFSFLRLLKKLSATALSQQFPRRLMLGSMLSCFSSLAKLRLLYCEPWSECSFTTVFGLRRQYAIVNASNTKSSVMR